MLLHHTVSISSYINERDTSTFDCKHQHMFENGAPPHKFGVFDCLSHNEFHGLKHTSVPGINSSFLQKVFVPLIKIVKVADLVTFSLSW